MSKKEKHNKSLRSVKAIARQRLKRDFIELQREKLLSINAHPLDDNLFEWHANIKPTDGVYSGVYFHLILIFPDSYPSLPPKVKIQTPISHPNVFGDWLCLSMLREHTTNVPYEGWSGAYSCLSILMQLQSFLFADKIDQDGGYQVNARLSQSAVKQSIQTCKNFRCKKCSHNHLIPWPKVQGPPEALVRVYAMYKSRKYVSVQGSHCQTTHDQWVGAYGQYGCNYGKIMYEAYVDWTANESKAADIVFGFGTEQAYICGADLDSCGYMGCGAFIFNDGRRDFGETFCKNDTITCAIDFNTEMIYFGKNGNIISNAVDLPHYLTKKQLLYPVLSFKQARAEFNFGAPKKPCKFLLQNGFKTLEQIATAHGITKDEKKQENDNNDVNWHSRYIIPELWVAIFAHLSVQDVFSVGHVCRKWLDLVNKYNVTERTEMFCYFTKDKLGQTGGTNKSKILGIGLNICESEVGFRVELNSQMDILGLNAWNNGCRVGVWGEPLTHFLPLVMDKQHAELAHPTIIKYLKRVAEQYKSIQMKSFHGAQREKNPNTLEYEIKNSECLQQIDIVITMMNQIVAQFVTGNEDIDPKTVSMVLCEKVVIGYCYLHHLLLYLKSKNKKKVSNFANKCVNLFIKRQNGPSKEITRDLGKFLIYLMISTKYKWSDVAAPFVQESFTRRIRWFVQNEQYAYYDTTKYIDGRVRNSFISSKTGRRLVRFQVWFMKNNADETLQGYNHRLGRPRMHVREGIVPKSKEILTSTSYVDYFKELSIASLNAQKMDQLLRFAVYNSFCRGYHWRKDINPRERNQIYKSVYPPKIIVKMEQAKENKKKSRPQQQLLQKNILRVANKSRAPRQIQSHPQTKQQMPQKNVLSVVNVRAAPSQAQSHQAQSHQAQSHQATQKIAETKVTTAEVVNKPESNNINDIKETEQKQQTTSKAQRRKRRKNKLSQKANKNGMRPTRPPLRNKPPLTNESNPSITKPNKPTLVQEEKEPKPPLTSSSTRSPLKNESNPSITKLNKPPTLVQKEKKPIAKPPLKKESNEDPQSQNIITPIVNTQPTQQLVQKEQKPKLSKAQRRKQRMKKNKNRHEY